MVIPDRAIRRVLADGALVFGLLGLVRPRTLARMVAADEDVARLLGVRDLGNAVAFRLAGDGALLPLAQRIAYDLGDAALFGPRKPRVAAGALAFAALGALALAARR